MSQPTTMESACATVDISRLPLIVQTVKNLNPTIPQTREHLDLIESVLQNSSGPLFIIFGHESNEMGQHQNNHLFR